MIIKANPAWKDANRGKMLMERTGVVREYTRGRGWQLTEVWDGTPELAMVGLAYNYADTHDSVRCYRDGTSPIWRVEATVGGQEGGNATMEPNENSHELLSNVLEQDTRINKRVIALVGGADNMFPLLTVVDDWDAGTFGTLEAALDVVEAIMPATATEEQIASAKAFFRDQIEGRNKSYVTQYVYRRSLTNLRGSSLEVKTDGVGYIWDTSVVLSYEGLGTSPPGFPLPTGDWLKMAPNFNQTANNRVQVTYEYWWGDSWSELYYPRYT